ncbi:MAG: 3-deoxy-7-phosphoheptulonate synthase [Bacteroidales bacterium]|jgi:3-deoxy-7-phosphoheptulonate synthase
METNPYNNRVNGGSAIPSRVSRKTKPDNTIVSINDVQVGGSEIIVIAGPCAVESRLQLFETARLVKAGGARILRGGAFKPRSSPYNFQGLGEEGLKLLAMIREETGLPIVTEVMDTRQIELVASYADMIQIGSRNMQNYPLLKEAGMCRKPVLLKRGMMATIEEYLLAAEYILNQGNDQVILCERGIRTFEPSTRNTLDLSAVPMLKRLSHLPVIVDPSHGTGLRWMVPALAKAAVAVGADGLIMEVHYKPEEALCDGYQSLSVDEFARLMSDLNKIARAVGREISVPKPSTV